MAFALAAGSACGCTHKENDDGKQGAKEQGFKQQGEDNRTDDTESIAEKYRKKRVRGKQKMICLTGWQK